MLPNVGRNLVISVLFHVFHAGREQCNLIGLLYNDVAESRYVILNCLRIREEHYCSRFVPIAIFKCLLYFGVG